MMDVIHEVQKWKDCRPLGKVFLFIEFLTNRHTGQEKTALMKSMHTRYSEIVTELIGDIGQRI